MHSAARFAVALILAVSAANCGSSSSPSPSPSPSPTPSPSPLTVSIVVGARTLTTTAYNPNPVTVSVGGTVTWVNNDTIAHTSTANNGSWDSGLMAAGARFSRTFPSAGTFQYYCTIHPNMVGTVMVQ